MGKTEENNNQKTLQSIFISGDQYGGTDYTNRVSVYMYYSYWND